MSAFKQTSRLPTALALLACAALACACTGARADGPHKQTGPIDIGASVQGAPRSGVPLSIEVRIAPRLAVPSLEVSLVASEGLTLRSAAHYSYGALAAHDTQTITVQVTPQAPGLQLLSVIADAGGISEGASRRTYSIELAVDGVGVEKSKTRPAPTDATGQKIKSLHGRDR